MVNEAEEFPVFPEPCLHRWETELVNRYKIIGNYAQCFKGSHQGAEGESERVGLESRVCGRCPVAWRSPWRKYYVGCSLEGSWGFTGLGGAE